MKPLVHTASTSLTRPQAPNHLRNLWRCLINKNPHVLLPSHHVHQRSRRCCQRGATIQAWILGICHRLIVFPLLMVKQPHPLLLLPYQSRRIVFIEEKVLQFMTNLQHIVKLVESVNNLNLLLYQALSQHRYQPLHTITHHTLIPILRTLVHQWLQLPWHLTMTLLKM